VGPLLATVACLVGSAACPVTPPEPTVPVERFSAVYERSGGFAPTTQRLVIRPGRHAVATYRPPDGPLQTARFRLSVLTVKRLRNALSQPHFPGYESPPNTTCADCREYRFEFRGDSVSFAENHIPAWLRKTVLRCDAIVEAHLPFH
jgi:hypothetical protein